MREVFVFGLNPAWQKVLHLNGFTPGAVNRANNAAAYPSGKGMNFVYVMHKLGGRCCLFQFLGGKVGESYFDTVLEKEFLCSTVRIQDETRICTTLIAEEDTEVIEPSPNLYEHEIEAMMQLARERAERSFLNHSPPPFAVICGTAPEGWNAGHWVDLYHAAENCLWIVDGVKDVEFLLQERLFLLKVNTSEFEYLLQGRSSEEFLKQSRIEHVLITDGPGAVQYFSKSGIRRNFPVPEVNNVVNTIGAGDTFLAALVYQLRQMELDSIEPAIQFAIAAAVNKVSKVFPWEIESGEIKDIQERLKKFGGNQ